MPDFHVHAVGVQVLDKAAVKDIFVESFGDAEASAEGTHLGLFSFDKMKGSKKDKLPQPSVGLWR